MALLKYENLTHAELAALPRDRTVVLISVGPLEQHGPHLPLGTDGLTARYFSERIAIRLGEKRSDWNFILFPTIFAGSDTLTHTGSIEVRPAVLRALLYDCCKQLAKDGFRNIIALGTHGGPRHSVVLEEVATKMRWRHRTRMINASARVLLEVLEGSFVEKIQSQLHKTGDQLSPEEQLGLKNDYHGGLLETSVMMAAHPDAVKPIYKQLKPALVSSYWKLRRSSGKTVGEGLGHLGSPALARPEIGKAAVEVLLDDVVPNIEQFLEGKNVYKHFRSKFYFIPIFRTDFKPILLLTIWLAVFSLVWILLNRLLMEFYK